MKKKVAYVINHISFFESHILPLALETIKQGYDIKVFCGQGGSKEMEVNARKVLKKIKLTLRILVFYLVKQIFSMNLNF